MILSTIIFFLLGFTILLVIIGYGFAFERLVLKKNSINLHEIGFFGYITIFLLANLLHFFTPLSTVITIFFLSIGIFFFLIFVKLKIFFTNKSIYVSLILFLLVALTIDYHDDSYWYQIPYINYYQNYKTVIGINTLNFYYYGNSVYEIMSLFNITSLPGSIIFLVPSTIIFFISFFILEEINLKKFNFGKILLVFFGFLILFRYTRSKEYGADLITMTFMFLVVYYFSKEIFRYGKKNIFKLNSFFIFAIFSKPYSIFIIFFPIYIFFKKYKKNIFFLKNLQILFFFLFLLVVPFLKNYLHTGCIYYPIKFTCVSTSQWYHGDDILNEISNSGSAIAKGFKNYIYENNNPYLTKSEFLNKYKFSYYKYLIKDSDFNRLFIALTTFIISFFVFFKKDYNKKISNKNNIIILTLSFLSFLFWFFTLPQSRYGGNIIILIFAGALFSFFFSSWYFRFSKIAKGFLLLSLIFFISKNFKRINFEITFAKDNEINFPFRKLDSFSAEQYLVNGETFYVSNDKLFCINTKYLCTTKLNFSSISIVKRQAGYLHIFPIKSKLKEALKDIELNHKKLWINYK